MQRVRIPPVPYLLRQVRVGVVATGITVVAIAIAYFALKADEFHRAGLAIVLGVAAAGGVVVGMLPWRRLIETSGMRPLYAWSATSCWSPSRSPPPAVAGRICSSSTH